MSVHVHPLSPTDGYVFVVGVEPGQIREVMEGTIRDAIANLYTGGLDRRLIDLPVGGRRPLVKGKDNPGGSRVTYRIRVERPAPAPKSELPRLSRAERRQLSQDLRRATA